MIDKQNSTSTQEFFIPDLCNVQAVLFLVIVAELLAIVLELAGAGLGGFSWESFALISLFVQWAFLVSAILLCQLRSRLVDWPLHWSASLCYLVILAVAASTSVLGQWMMAGTLRATGNWSINISKILSDVLICAVLAGIALRYFYLTQQLRLRQRTELQARIQALQSRIRPHFLFNSMNIIASLIAVDQEAAETAVEDLASLFRASLAEAQTEVNLEDELDLCRRYARIEQLRLGKRLQVEWQVDAVPVGIRVPSLTLQPLLENAIYHGIQQLPDGGVVIVRAKYNEGEVTLSVINPIPDNKDNHHSGNRIAQDNIHRRFQAIYGPKAELVTSINNQQHCAVINYPFDLGSYERDEAK